MGYAIAEEAALRGANVSLISGPVSIQKINSSIQLTNVVSADEMFQAVKSKFNNSEIVILSAAVADFTPIEVNTDKIKDKTGLTINLKPTVDIAKEIGLKKKENQVFIGFALETSNELENAQNKLKKKNFDFIVLNSLRDKGAGFKTDTNKITIIDKHNNISKFELKSKAQVANDILDKTEELLS